jgi:hypothetical protein
MESWRRLRLTLEQMQQKLLTKQFFRVMFSAQNTPSLVITAVQSTFYTTTP